jgi:hypothetical protein
MQPSELPESPDGHKGRLRNGPSTVFSVANARDKSTLGVLGPKVKLGFMAGQSMASMENHQIWARNLRISGQKLNSAAPSQKMQLRTNPGINDTPDHRPNHEIHHNHQIHQISLIVDVLHRRVVPLFS